MINTKETIMISHPSGNHSLPLPPSPNPSSPHISLSPIFPHCLPLPSFNF